MQNIEKEYFFSEWEYNSLSPCWHSNTFFRRIYEWISQVFLGSTNLYVRANYRFFSSKFITKVTFYALYHNCENIGLLFFHPINKIFSAICICLTLENSRIHRLTQLVSLIYKINSDSTFCLLFKRSVYSRFPKTVNLWETKMVPSLWK